VPDPKLGLVLAVGVQLELGEHAGTVRTIDEALDDLPELRRQLRSLVSAPTLETGKGGGRCRRRAVAKLEAPRADAGRPRRETQVF
jgi:hypothetical protein